MFDSGGKGGSGGRNYRPTSNPVMLKNDMGNCYVSETIYKIKPYFS